MSRWVLYELYHFKAIDNNEKVTPYSWIFPHFSNLILILSYSSYSSVTV